MWIKVKEIISEGERLPIHSATTFFMPTHFSYLNNTYVEKWGRFWNLWLLDEAKTQLQLTIMYSLGGDGFSYSTYTILGDTILGDTIRITIFRILTHPIFLKPIFWTAVIFRAINIDDKGNITSNLRWLNAEKIRNLLGLRWKVYS